MMRHHPCKGECKRSSVALCPRSQSPDECPRHWQIWPVVPKLASLRSAHVRSKARSVRVTCEMISHPSSSSVIWTQALAKKSASGLFEPRRSNCQRGALVAATRVLAECERRMSLLGSAFSLGASRGWAPHPCCRPAVGNVHAKPARVSCQRCCIQSSIAARAANFRTNELVIGDSLACVAFCLYKQIMAIAMSPTFAGWQAPLSFNLLRFEELVGFTLTIAGTWVATSTLNGDYQAHAAGACRSLQCNLRALHCRHATIRERLVYSRLA